MIKQRKRKIPRRDGTRFRAQVESLALYKSIDSSSLPKKREGTYMYRDNKLVHMGVGACGSSFLWLQLCQ